MTKIITSILMTVINRLIDADVRKEIMDLVKSYMNVEGLSGPEKKASVSKELQELKGALGDNIREMKGWIVSTGIDIYHAWLKERQ